MPKRWPSSIPRSCWKAPFSTAVASLRSDSSFPLSTSKRWRIVSSGSHLADTFEGEAYMYVVLPSLASRTFTKCIDAAPLPSEADGNPNYIRLHMTLKTGWYWPDQSGNQSLTEYCHSATCRSTFSRVNCYPDSGLSFWAQLYTLPRWMTSEQSPTIQRLVASPKSGTSSPLKVFQRLLGLIVAASYVILLGLIRMRPLQYWLKVWVRLSPCGAWASFTSG